MSRDNQTCSAAGHNVRSRAGLPFGASVCDSTNRHPGPGGGRTPTQTIGQKDQSGVKEELLDWGQGMCLKVHLCEVRRGTCRRKPGS